MTESEVSIPFHGFERLLQFPLFQGMSQTELVQVVAHTKFNFVKYDCATRVIKTGEACHHFHFLTHGQLQLTTAYGHGISVSEQVEAPSILQPECLFGLPQRFRSTFIALTPVNFITLDKNEVLHLCETFRVFQLNLLNMISAKSQRLLLIPTLSHPQTLRDHIVNYLVTHCQIPVGEKVFHILMNQLALEVNDSRTDVSRELNRMQTEGLICLSRGRIKVPAIESLSNLKITAKKAKI